ncbi:MAG: hypothetical protein II574_10585 [Ruminococcus sp.]|nr:hypothetical protein [Ruminococcus sp.]
MSKIRSLYRNDTLMLADDDGELYLIADNKQYHITSQPYEPCMYLRCGDESEITVHNAFTTDTLCRLADSHGKATAMSGNEHDLGSLCSLLLLAVGCKRTSVDFDYLESLTVIENLHRLGAVSPETAADAQALGLCRTNFLRPFVHSKKLFVTQDGKYYLNTNKQ